MIKLLVVDDSALVRRLIAQIFTREGDVEVCAVRSGLEALEVLQSFGPNVITLDVHMPEMDGLACLDRIMVERPTPVVMVSSLTAAGADATLEALRLGAVDFVTKPDGAVTLKVEEWAPVLIEKVRAAADARLKGSLRLKERVRHRIKAGASQLGDPKVGRGRFSPSGRAAATGEGLVLVGTSTGGPPALEALLTPLPADFAWPIVIAQHMPASFTGALARRLDGLCALTVSEVTRPTLLRSGCAYIGKGDADVIISRRATGWVAMPAPPQKSYPWHPSTDRLVRSAMEVVPPHQLVGVLMTGMGHDGAKAMARLRELGGRTIAEAEETAVVWGMPGELVKAGGADWIEPLPGIASRLKSLTP